RPANDAQPQTNLYAVIAKAPDHGCELLRRVDQSQVARALRKREMLRLLGVTRNVDLGHAAIRGEKRREQFSLFDTAVSTCEIDRAVVGPERPAHTEKLFGARVPFVMVQKITVSALLDCGTARDDIQTHSSANHTRKRIDLLNECRRLHQTEPVGDDKLELLR